MSILYHSSRDYHVLINTHIWGTLWRLIVETTHGVSVYLYSDVIIYLGMGNF